MNTPEEMTTILDRKYLLLNKKEKEKINRAIKSINEQVQAPNNFPKIMREAIKETAKIKNYKMSQEKYYNDFLSNLDVSMEYISSNDYKPYSPNFLSHVKNTSIEDETLANYYYPNFDLEKDNDFITFNSYKKYLNGIKRSSLIRMYNLLKFFEETANEDDPRKYADEFDDINYLKNYNHFSYHQTLFDGIGQEINYIHKLIIDSLNCFVKMNQVVSSLLPSSINIFDKNIDWIKNFSKFNSTALAKLDLAQKVLNLEEIKLTNLSKIKLTNRTDLLKKTNYYIETAQSSFYDDVLTGKPVNTIIGDYIDHYFLEKYYDITSPSWIPVQINEADFIYLISTKSILDFLHDMLSKIKTSNKLLNTPGFTFRK